MSDAVPSQRRAARWWTIATIATAALAAVFCAILLAVHAEWLDLLGWLAAYVGLLLAGGLWLAFAIVGAVRYRSWRLTLIAPIIVVVTTVLAFFEVPGRAVFAVSRGALTDAAQECAEGGKSWHGAVRVDRTRRLDDGTCLFYTPGGFIDSVGWAYVPDAVGVPVSDPNDGGISYAHVTGDWYRFTWHF